MLKGYTSNLLSELVNFFVEGMHGSLNNYVVVVVFGETYESEEIKDVDGYYLEYIWFTLRENKI